MTKKIARCARGSFFLTNLSPSTAGRSSNCAAVSRSNHDACAPSETDLGQSRAKQLCPKMLIERSVCAGSL